ncbi:DUF58 domain-containing protein [Halocatena pleomorpha]|uniref:DUF58 domain-containing protein n=1 Tax=Halocatena pleomorpha TaxID=1785090 RepID=A0A3P3R9U8_9EURY|nr:DUF58 domain-containing protein [Halocatena pleomorpha]RRJ29460.1 DUF58 domain-containing protein [Halocatena pleomorpha]
MEVKQRYKSGVILGCLLACGAWLFNQPLLLIGATGIAASLLVHQYRFMRDVLTATDKLTLTQSITPSHVTTDKETSVALRATLPETTPLAVTVEPQPPVTATGLDPDEHRLTLVDEKETATTTFSLRWPIAGKFECSSPMVTLTDRAGLFRSQVSMGPSTTVTVVPRQPRTLHVGVSGTSTPTMFGERRTGECGVGLDPAETRQYLPGDTLRQVDWKATARTGSPHVHEFHAEIDLSTALVVDHRLSMATGTTGETKLDCLRQVALTYADHAQMKTEPLSLYTVGDNGVTTALGMESNTRHYTHVETILHDLDPTDNREQPTDQTGANQLRTRHENHTRRLPDTRSMAAALRTDASSFGRTLLPYVAEPRGYVQQIQDDPLFETVRTYLGGNSGSVITVLLTDDTHRTEVREAVRTVRRHSEHVLVFLTPTILFERGGLETIETAYDSYVEFEEFRRNLAYIDGVSAFEVAPADRIEAVLAATQQTSTAPAGGR